MEEGERRLFEKDEKVHKASLSIIQTKIKLLKTKGQKQMHPPLFISFPCIIQEVV